MTIWNWFTGKKTIISLILLEIVRELQAIHPDWTYWPVIIKALVLLSGGSLLHKAARTKTMKKLFKKNGKGGALNGNGTPAT